MKNQEQTNAIQVLEKEALIISDQGKLIQVVDEGTLVQANDVLIRVKTLRKGFKSLFVGMKKKARASLNEIIDTEKKCDLPLMTIENFLKPQIASYQREQEEARRAEQERIEKELEAKRQEAERLRKEAEEAEKDWDDEKSTVMKDKAEKISEETKELTEDLIETPGPTKLEGTGIRQDWKWREETPGDISKVPRSWLILDEKALNAHARKMKDKAEVPGIVFYPEDVVITRTE